MKIFKILVCLCTAAMLFASCKFNGTTTDYSPALSNQGAKLVKNPNTNAQWLNTDVQISLTGLPLKPTNEVHTLTLTISSPFHIDMATLDNALTFHQATGADTDAVAKEAKTLPYTRITVVETPDSLNKKTVTTITLDVDFSGVTEGSAFFKIDAEKLKDVYGNFMLNENRNEKAGEAADTYIRWVNDSDAPPAPTFYKSSSPSTPVENPCVSWLPDPCPFIWEKVGITESSDFLGKGIGYAMISSKLDGRYYIVFDEIPHPIDNTPIEAQGILSKIYSYELIKPGETAWSEAKFFEFKHGQSGDEYGFANKYYALTEPFLDGDAGTQIRIFRNYSKLSDADLSVLNFFETMWGAPAVWGTSDTKSRVQISTTEIGVYTKDPEYIFSANYFTQATNTDITTLLATPQTLDASSLRTTQKNAFSGITRESKVPMQYKIPAPAGYEFVASSITDDSFIITDTRNKKLDATVTPVFEAGNENKTKASAVRICLNSDVWPTNKADVKLWVGSVEITKGEDATLRTQKFGKYKDYRDGDASGYVELTLP